MNYELHQPFPQVSAAADEREMKENE